MHFSYRLSISLFRIVQVQQVCSLIFMFIFNAGNPLSRAGQWTSPNIVGKESGAYGSPMTHMSQLVYFLLRGEGKRVCDRRPAEVAKLSAPERQKIFQAPLGHCCKSLSSHPQRRKTKRRTRALLQDLSTSDSPRKPRGNSIYSRKLPCFVNLMVTDGAPSVNYTFISGIFEGIDFLESITFWEEDEI